MADRAESQGRQKVLVRPVVVKGRLDAQSQAQARRTAHLVRRRELKVLDPVAVVSPRQPLQGALVGGDGLLDGGISQGVERHL